VRLVERLVHRGSGRLLLWALVTTLGCHAAAPVTATKVAIATGGSSGVFYVVGKALAEAFDRRTANVSATVLPGHSLEGSLDALVRGDVDLAFVDSETTYVAYRKGTHDDPTPHTGIRAVAVLFPTVVHVFARYDSGIMRITDFRKRRLHVGPKGSEEARAAKLIFDSYRLGEKQVTFSFGSNDTIAADLRRGSIDGFAYWAPLRHRAIEQVAAQVDLRLLPIQYEQIALIQEHDERSRFLKSITIPKHTYPHQEHDVLTLAEDILLLCRADLSEAVVYDVTRTLFESVPDLARAHPAARAINPQRGPTTSIPLHPGAAHYYREQELPR